MSYIVTRQMQWPYGQLVVEISEGGWDYVNPDALSAKYPGEFEEYKDPREALKTAIKIVKAWKKDKPEAKIGIATGYTGGYTMPFEPQSLKELNQWAQEEASRLPKCARCGKILESIDSDLYIDDSDDLFCSAFCADETYCERYYCEHYYKTQAA
ncbi:MAG: hypothetical protein U9Q84_01215 [Thermodesulfobacteriota bacterium]|nr:hypothetical protein [Thermodesulfobacteriota bacterium]